MSLEASLGEGLYPPRRKQYYFLTVLGLVYLCNFIDRQIINIVAEAVKNDLHLSDSQLGLLTGLVFAVFYTSLGLPMARLTERGNRTRILAGALATWSLFTAVCGFAQSFVQLLLARVGVAVGESSCTPASHSLISDYFPHGQRARALAVFALGSPLGGLFGLFVGGMVVGSYGWRAAFWVVGAPGFLLVPLLLFTMYEPRLRAAKTGAAKTITRHKDHPRFSETLAVLRGKPSFWLACIGSSCFAMFGLAQGAFIASFYLRNHHGELTAIARHFGLSDIGFLGIALGVMLGLGGSLGTLLGGALADHLGKKDLSKYLYGPMVAGLVIIPLHLTAMTVDSLVLSLCLLVTTSLCQTVFIGPTWAMVQGLVAPNMRATSAAIQLMFNNLIGLGIGPLLVGGLSDLFAVRLGLGSGEGLRWALMALALIGIPASVLYALAGRHVARDFHRPAVAEPAGEAA